MQATAIIEDFTALGTISSAAALDVLHGMGITTAVLPAMLFSTSTEGFGDPVRLQTRDWVQQSFAHWQAQQNLQLTAGLVGYLGTKAMIEEVARIAQHCRWKNFLVDPVMADDGQLYDGFSADYPAAMLKLAKMATVMTPNWTELQLLAGDQPVQAADSDQCIGEEVGKLRQAGVAAAIVVTGIHRQGQLGSLIFPANSSDQPAFTGSKPYPGHFYGTGDTFSALLMGYRQQGCSLKEAVAQATTAIDIAVAETTTIPVADRIYGMKTRRLLQYLTTNNQERPDKLARKKQ